MPGCAFSEHLRAGQGDLILEAADILLEDPMEHYLIPFESRVHLPLRSFHFFVRLDRSDDFS
jgi:hypothetical protein